MKMRAGLLVLIIISCANAPTQNADNVEIALSETSQDETNNEIIVEIVNIEEQTPVEKQIPIEEQIPIEISEIIIDDVLPVAEEVNDAEPSPSLITYEESGEEAAAESSPAESIIAEANEEPPPDFSAPLAEATPLPYTLPEAAPVSAPEIPVPAGPPANTSMPPARPVPAARPRPPSPGNAADNQSAPPASPPPTPLIEQIPDTIQEQPAETSGGLPLGGLPSGYIQIPPDEPAAKQYDFSRRARATVGQLVEIPFRGTGWVFLGEADARRGVAYDSRRLDPEGQSFIFRAERAGIYALKFYRQDFIRDFILNDYVQVTVGDAPESASSGWFNPQVDRGRVIAGPRWPASINERTAGEQTQPANSGIASVDTTVPPATVPTTPVSPPPVSPTPVPATTVPTTPVSPTPVSPAPTSPAIVSPSPASPTPVPAVPASPAQPPRAVEPEPPQQPSLSPDAIVAKAKEEFNAGRTAVAISLLDQFRALYPSGSDEAWWLYAQCYEANSPSRNVLAALEYYRRLLREYPQSSRTSDAQRRIAYIERYFINIQ